MAPLGLSALSSLLRRRPRPEPWSIPQASWSRSFGLGWRDPYSVRYASNLDDGPWHGMPLGGFGAGCIGRSSRGDFNLWHLDGGEHWYGTIPDCQFAMWESDGTNTRAHALATAPDRDDTRVDGEDPLAAWQWYPASTNDTTTGTYAARYPLSWTRYTGVFAAEVSCEAFSPILPGDYQRSSYPVAVFRWTLRNPSNRPLQLSLLLSWRNTVGWFTNTDPSAEVHFRDDGSPEHNYAPAIGAGEGQSNRWVDQPGLKGVLLDGPRSQPLAEGEGQWCLALPDDLEDVEVMRCSRWDPTGDGAELWQSFAAEGRIPNSNNDRASR